MAATSWQVYRVVERYAIPLFVSAVLVLLLLGFARIYTVTNDLRRTQHEACLLRREGRANTNLHDRVPLRAALQYLGDAVAASAGKQPDPEKRREALRFAHRFQAYAAAVEPLSNPKC
jgi:hypothetical protein